MAVFVSQIEDGFVRELVVPALRFVDTHETMDSALRFLGQGRRTNDTRDEPQPVLGVRPVHM